MKFKENKRKNVVRLPDKELYNKPTLQKLYSFRHLRRLIEVQ